jgi:hypothetical protein
MVAASLLIGATLASNIAGAPARASGSIGAASLILDENFVTADGSVVDAFVPTGSDHTGCIATLAESDFAVAGSTLYCNNRVVDGVHGIRLALFLPQAAPADVVFQVTVYQEFAREYGAPVPCSQVVGC